MQYLFLQEPVLQSVQVLELLLAEVLDLGFELLLLSPPCRIFPPFIHSLSYSFFSSSNCLYSFHFQKFFPVPLLYTP